MLDKQYEDVAPELKPITDENEKLGLSLKSREKQITPGKKRCPHCDRVIPEDDRVCMSCGYDLKKGKTQQERNKKSGSPVKVLLTLAFLAGAAAAGYYYKDQIMELVNGKKEAIEASESDSSNFDIGTDQGLGDTAEPKLDPNFKISGDPQEVYDDLEVTIEDLTSELEGKQSDIKDYETEYKEYVTEFKKATKSKEKYMALYKKAKTAKASRSKIESIKEKVIEFRDMCKEYESEGKLAQKELMELKKSEAGLTKKLKETKAKLKQVEAYMNQ